MHWEVHDGENGDLAKAFITSTIKANGGARPKYIHADNGTSMTFKTVAQLLSDLHVTKSYSRPHYPTRTPPGGELQDPQIPPGAPRQLRHPRRRPAFRRCLLHLLQHRAPAFRHRPGHPASVHDGTAWAIQARRQQARQSVRRPPRAVPRPARRRAEATRQGMDQQATPTIETQEDTREDPAA